jgi:hypothetical protein
MINVRPRPRSCPSGPSLLLLLLHPPPLVLLPLFLPVPSFLFLFILRIQELPKDVPQPNDLNVRLLCPKIKRRDSHRPEKGRERCVRKRSVESIDEGGGDRWVGEKRVVDVDRHER